jgi:beta-galactosidase
LRAGCYQVLRIPIRPSTSQEDKVEEEKFTLAELSRRRFISATVGGGTGLAAWSLLGGQASAATRPSPSPSRAPSGAAGLVVPLNTGWLFGGTWVQGSGQPGYNDSGFRAVTLPHVVTPLPWREWDPATWEKVWIYRRHFGLPPSMRGMRTFVDFQGALTSATPTINGTRLAEHMGGYLPFSYELTDDLHPQGNVLAVKVDSTWQNVPPEGAAAGAASVDYLEPGGLNRDMALRFVPQIFVADVFAEPAQVLSATPEVDVQCTIDAAVVPAGPVQVVAELFDQGRRLARASAPVPLSQPAQVSVSLRLAGFGPARLWDYGHPSLYDVVTTVTVGGQPVHDFTRRIGFREALFQTDGFFLNGSRLKLFGLDRHQIFPYSGMAMPARVQRRDAETLKQLNCNMVRCSHYPQSLTSSTPATSWGSWSGRRRRAGGTSVTPHGSRSCCRTCTTWWSATAAVPR